MAVNSGSSSLKLTVYKNPSTDVRPDAAIEISIANIGAPEASIRIKGSNEHHASRQIHFSSHEAALKASLRVLDGFIAIKSLAAIGHRIVFGGARNTTAEIIDADVLDSLRQSSRFDPDHMPTALRLIEAMADALPEIPQVACYDTAFYDQLPILARAIPLPREYREKGIRRYGYHGLSYEYILREFGRIAGDHAARGRVIMAHLGSGVSLVALKNGMPVDMTMGFTPTSGVMMSTRTGDLDPGVSYFLQTELGLSVQDYYELVNEKSGLLGVSGQTADMEVLVQKYDDDANAAEAVDLFCYQVRKAIGSLASTIGGVDSLVFTGGMGERAPFIRQKICDELGYLGISLDKTRNEKHLELISAEGSRVGVHVLPTNEAHIIATLTKEILSANNTTGN